MQAMFKLRDESGAVTVMVAVAMVALLLSLAFIIDIGLLYQERRQLQTSTDAAALAAAMDLAEGKSVGEAESKAIQYVSSNANVNPSQVSIDYPAGNQVRVTAKTVRSLFMAGIVGRGSSGVTAKSTAALGAAKGVAKLVPFIVPLQRVQEYTGEGNIGTFELGEDRPLGDFSVVQSVSGDTITYTITYNNTGTKTESISVRDPIPGGTVYVSGSATAGGSYDASSNEVNWYFSDVAPGNYRIMRLSVNGSSGSIKNTAYLSFSDSGKTMTASSDENAQKGYFWLCDFNGGRGGVPDYASWIKEGFPEYVYTGDIANGEGVKASLKDALSWRKGFDSSVVVPIYSYTDGGGSPGKYHVIGFAEFVITNFNLSGQPKTVSGYFTNGTVVSGVPGPAPQGYFGVDTIWLVH